MSNKKETKDRNLKQIYVIVFSILIFCVAYFLLPDGEQTENNIQNENIQTSTIVKNTVNIGIEDIPEYFGEIVITINNDVPYFANELTTEDFRIYMDLDEIDKGRAQMAFVNVSKDTMPMEGTNREQLTYNPTGWNQILYGENNKYHLYERCHLIAWSLGNQNNNPKNLITGTRQMNQAMIPYENEIREWINVQYKAGNKYHVMYRVTPIYKDDNLVANGVELEAESVEDTKAIKFNKFIYNVEEVFEIDYKTGNAKW